MTETIRWLWSGLRITVETGPQYDARCGGQSKSGCGSAPTVISANRHDRGVCRVGLKKIKDDEYTYNGVSIEKDYEYRRVPRWDKPYDDYVKSKARYYWVSCESWRSLKFLTLSSAVKEIDFWFRFWDTLEQNEIEAHQGIGMKFYKEWKQYKESEE